MAALQWADVVVIAERCTELDKLKQVRRQGSKPVHMQLDSQRMVVQQKLGQGAFASVYQVCLCTESARSVFLSFTDISFVTSAVAQCAC